MSRLPDPERSRAVLLGSSRYPTADSLPEIASVRANLTDLGAALTGASTGTLEPEHCRTLTDPTSAADIGDAVATAATEATDLLLVYYAGHGLVDERGRLHLSLSTTDPARVRWTAVPLEMLREEIAASPAAVRVLVLDCCFSGRAIGAMSDVQGIIAGQTDIYGTCTLTSTTGNALSHAPVGATHTAFTGALLAASRAPEPLTLDELFRQVDHYLAVRGLPRPQRRVVNAVGSLALFGGSPAARSAEEPSPARADEPAESAALETRLAAAMRSKLTRAATVFAAQAAEVGARAGAGSFDASWTDQRPAGYRTVVGWIARSWQSRAIVALLVLLAPPLLLYWPVHQGITDGYREDELWIAVPWIVSVAVLAAVTHHAYVLRRFSPGARSWAVHVGPDGVVVTEPCGRREFGWARITGVTVEAFRSRGPDVFTAICLEFALRDLPVETLPAGWPHPELGSLHDHERRRYKRGVLPVCVLGPLTEQRRDELATALSAHGAGRWRRSEGSRGSAALALWINDKAGFLG